MLLIGTQESGIIARIRHRGNRPFLRITDRDAGAARNYVIKAVTVQRAVAIDRRLSHLCYSSLLLVALSTPSPPLSPDIVSVDAEITHHVRREIRGARV